MSSRSSRSSHKCIKCIKCKTASTMNNYSEILTLDHINGYYKNISRIYL